MERGVSHRDYCHGLEAHGTGVLSADPTLDALSVVQVIAMGKITDLVTVQEGHHANYARLGFVVVVVDVAEWILGRGGIVVSFAGSGVSVFGRSQTNDASVVAIVVVVSIVILVDASAGADNEIVVIDYKSVQGTGRCHCATANTFQSTAPRESSGMARTVRLGLELQDQLPTSIRPRRDAASRPLSSLARSAHRAWSAEPPIGGAMVLLLLLLVIERCACVPWYALRPRPRSALPPIGGGGCRVLLAAVFGFVAVVAGGGAFLSLAPLPHHLRGPFVGPAPQGPLGGHAGRNAEFDV